MVKLCERISNPCSDPSSDAVTRSRLDSTDDHSLPSFFFCCTLVFWYQRGNIASEKLNHSGLDLRRKGNVSKCFENDNISADKNHETSKELNWMCLVSSYLVIIYIDF